MSNSIFKEIIIIGGGPSGLAAAYYLQQKKLDFLIIEKFSVGYSWGNMPKYWRVVSPQWTNTLPSSRFPYSAPYAKPPVTEYQSYLQEYAQNLKFNIVENTEILSANKHNEKFILTTSKNKYVCDKLISATGYYTSPYTPNLPKGNDGSIEYMHVANYSCPEDLRKRHPKCTKILIIGRRVSAGQLLTDLCKFDYELSISSRGPIRPRDGSIKGKVKEFIYFPYEELKIKFQPRLYADSFPQMDGGKTEELFANNKVYFQPNIEGIKNENVLFSDGTKKKYDLIIFATGYRPTLSYLENIISTDPRTGVPPIENFQSKEVANLFFIGLDQIYNFRSRYLRGIRRDALQLSKVISE